MDLYDERRELLPKRIRSRFVASAMWKRIMFSLVAIGWSVSLLAQENAPKIPRDIIESQTLIAKGQYLAALAIAEKSTAPKEMLAQQLATIRSFVGDCNGAIEAMKSLLGDRSISMDSIPLDCMPTDAIDAIVEQAKNRQVVILNEAHHVPLHRAFGLSLAIRLRKIGFNYLAVETLTHPTRELVQRTYPVRESGYYTQEPVFGDFVRQAVSLGFKPIAYECESIPASNSIQSQIQHRESEQARNLVDRIFVENPKAKVLIYVGYQHATEDFQLLPGGGELGWMAAQLGRRLQLDPLTIDQTTVFSRHGSTISDFKKKLSERELQDKPICVQTADGSFYVGGEYAKKVDIQVLHADTTILAGRPTWLNELAGRKSVPIPDEMHYPERVLIQAFVAGESETAVPLDQLLLEPDRPHPSLMLRKGQYRIVVQNGLGVELTRFVLSVE